MRTPKIKILLFSPVAQNLYFLQLFYAMHFAQKRLSFSRLSGAFVHIFFAFLLFFAL